MVVDPGGRATTAAARLAPGDRVGSFTIEAILDEGIAATRYRGCHDILSSSAAVRVLRADLVGRWAVRERMLLEARILHALRHPAIVEIYDAGVLDDGRTWVASELVEGEAVAAYLMRAGARPPRDVALLVRSIAEAVALLGSHGVVRRTLDPDQVVITSARGQLGVKVLDWGIADDAADERADVHALGTIASALAAGGAPGPELAALTAAMTAADPRARPTLAEVCARLGDLAGAEGSGGLEITEMVPQRWDDVAAPPTGDLDAEEPAEVALCALDDGEVDRGSSAHARQATIRIHGIPRG